jgi:hypothetical protein
MQNKLLKAAKKVRETIKRLEAIAEKLESHQPRLTTQHGGLLSVLSHIHSRLEQGTEKGDERYNMQHAYPKYAHSFDQFETDAEVLKKILIENGVEV